jgi:voltage-dependent calcium channel
MLSLWNRIDFIVLVALFFSTTTSVIYAGGLSRFTRALTAFRAFRLITLSQRMRNAFDAVLVGGALRILDACVLMLLYLIPFAVWG